MIRTKRLRISSNENETNKLQPIKIHANRLLFTRFEDLANEIIYEIFDFLDAYQIYKAFRDLNTRFQNLLYSSTFPLQVDMLSTSKPMLHRYYTQFIMSNIHRIHSFHLSKLSTMDLLFLLLQNTPKFTRLKRLVLDEITIYLEDLLHGLISCPCLSSLTINYDDPDPVENTLYHAIFQLPVLKYCKMVFNSGFGSDLLPICDNNYSPIEHLVMKGECELDFLAAFFSYVPQLRRLSINYPHADREVPQQTAEVFSVLSNRLTHVSLRLDYLSFYQFVPRIIKLFPNLQVLQISTNYDGPYLEAYEWEQLILSHMPHLRVFEIEYTNIVFSNEDGRMICQTLINQFNSSFWLQREWFFAHRYKWRTNTNDGIFYSTKLYRRKHYILNSEYDQGSRTCNEENNLNTVRYVDIQNEQAMIDCLVSFPNTTELTISTSFRITSNLLTTHLDRIVRLAQITVLTINHEDFPVNQLVEILLFTLNCHTLTISSIVNDRNNSRLPVKSDPLRSVSNESNIKNINITNKYTFETIDLLVGLCPRVEHLRINLSDLLTAPIIQFLLSITNVNTRHLFSLYLFKPDTELIKELKTLIRSSKLVDDYSVQVISGGCYLWW